MAIEPSLFLVSLHADRTRRHPGSPDAAVSGYHHCYGDPNMNIPACLEVELPPLCCEADGHTIQSGICLCAKNVIYRDNEQLKVAPLLQKVVKLIMILVSF